MTYGSALGARHSTCDGDYNPGMCVNHGSLCVRTSIISELPEECHPHQCLNHIALRHTPDSASQLVVGDSSQKNHSVQLD